MFLTGGLLYHAPVPYKALEAAQAPPQSSVEAPANASATAAGTSPTKPPSESSKEPGGPLVAICAYYGLAWPDVKKEEASALCRQALPPFHVLLAGVPSPERTHLALYLDRALQSIIAAAQDEGYSLATYWLPWDPDAQKLEPDAERRAKQVEARRAKERFPGVLYFVRAPASSLPASRPPLAVFLIPETPSSGINRFAFREALSYFAEPGSKASPLPHRNETGPAHKLPFLGPFFSGSLRSFRELAGAGQAYEAISGSVSDHAIAQEVFKGVNLTFRSTLQDDHVAGIRFLRYLRDQLSFSKAPVVILSEGGTAYGGVLDPRPGETQPVPVLNLRYPREISRIRNAYKESGPPASSDGKNPDPVQRGLPLVLRDEEGGRDSIPSFSQQQSPVSQEAVLLGIAETLRREHIKYAGLIATDVLDLLFLSRFLRIACPDLRIFVLETDLLFIRGLDTAPFEGIVSISTYPLFSRNQLWTQEQREGKPPRRFLFPSADAQGVYNAARAFFGPASKESAPDCHQNKSAPEPFLEYAPPGGGRQPPIWVNVIGHDGFWPVAFLDREKGETSSLYSSWCLDRHEAGLQLEPPSHLWQFGFVLLQAVALAHLMLLLMANYPRAEPWLRSKGLPYFWFEYYQARYVPGADCVRCFYLLVSTLPLLTLQLLVIAPLLHVPDAGGVAREWSPQQFLILPVFCAALLAIAAGWLTVHSFDMSLFSAGRVLVLLIFLGFLYVFSGLFAGQGSSGIFLAYRSLHPTNGLSPMTPFFFLLVALCYLAFVHLRRMRLNAISAPNLPPVGAGPGIAVERIYTCLRHSGAHSRLVVPVALLFLWLVLFRPWLHIQSFESRAYDGLFAALLTLLYGALFFIWWEFVYIWRHLKQFLEFLERHPIRDAFSRLPKEFSWMPIWQSNGLSLNYVDLTRTRDALARIDSAYTPRFRLAAIRSGIERLQAAQAENRPLDVAGYNSLQNTLREEIAETVWGSAARWSKGLSESYDRELSELKLVGKTDLNELEILQDEFIALRCLAFIRFTLMQLRNLLGFITTGFILSVLAVNSYPFEAHHIISSSVVLTFLLLGVGIVLVFVQMDRDSVLSRISQTEANKLNRGFVVRVVSFGALPMLTVLASQFPSFSGFLLSWVRPTLEALK